MGKVARLQLGSAEARFRRNDSRPVRAQRKRIRPATDPAESHQATIQQHLDRERLVLTHFVQVRCVAQRISSRLPPSIEVNDLVGAGVLGLLDAIDKFDPSRAVRFKTYAEVRVRGAILDSLRKLDWAPTSLRRKSRQLERAREELKQRLGRCPTDQEICELMNIPLKKLHKLAAQIRSLAVASIESPAERDRKEGIQSRYVQEAPERGPFWHCYRSEIRDRVAAAIAKLPRRERLVVLLHYFGEMSMGDLGRVLGVGRGGISFIHAKALGRLRRLTIDDCRLTIVD